MKNSEYREIALNGSGYHDPTAYKALKEALKEDKKMRDVMNDVLAGDIWTVQKATGNISEALILAKHQSYVTILLLTDKEPRENVIEVHSKSIMYADTGKISYAFSDTLQEFVKTVPDKEYDEIMRNVAYALGLDAYFTHICDESSEPNNSASKEEQSQHGAINAITAQDNEYRELQLSYAALERERDIYKELFYKVFPQIGGTSQ